MLENLEILEILESMGAQGMWYYLFTVIDSFQALFLSRFGQKSHCAGHKVGQCRPLRPTLRHFWPNRLKKEAFEVDRCL